MNLHEYYIGYNWETFTEFLKKRRTGIDTGIPALDKGLLGLRGIVGILGSPGTCKSTLALQIAANHADRYGPVIYYDRENGKERLRSRLACNIGNQFEAKLQATQGGEKETQEAVRKLPILVFYQQSQEEVEEAIKTLLQENKNVMLVVDSLQAMPMIAEDKRYSIDAWLQYLDTLKLKYEGKLTTVVTSEKNRGFYKDSDLGGGKESGSIEYKCEIQLDLVERDDEIQLTINKNRDGPKGGVVRLERCLANPNDPFSFSFKLKESNDYSDI